MVSLTFNPSTMEVQKWVIWLGGKRNNIRRRRQDVKTFTPKDFWRQDCHFILVEVRLYCLGCFISLIFSLKLELQKQSLVLLFIMLHLFCFNLYIISSLILLAFKTCSFIIHSHLANSFDYFWSFWRILKHML